MLGLDMELIRTNPDTIRKELESRLDIESLGGLDSSAGLAYLVRHAAGILCPISERSLIRAIVEPLNAIGLFERNDAFNECIEFLITQGDLLELEDIDDDKSINRKTLLYAAPPQFVQLSSTRLLLLGIAPDNTVILPSEISTLVENDGPLRFINPTKREGLPQQLIELGLHEVGAEVWLQAPQTSEADAFVDRMKKALSNTPVVANISDLSILDHSTSSKFYPSRWRNPSPATSGHFIGRRSGSYSGSQWSYVEISNGTVTRLLHLPFGRTNERGCDQAWRLQAAIDKLQGNSQKLRIRKLLNDKVSLDIFSPIPKWLERRWTKVGSRGEARECLASFHIDAKAIETEVAYAAERMWLEATQE
jgi:hypothetical protein